MPASPKPSPAARLRRSTLQQFVHEFTPFARRGVVPSAICLLMALVLQRKYPAMEGPRMALYLASFVIVRDAMTPVGLWALGATGKAGRPFFWLKLPNNVLTLAALAGGSLGIVLAMNALEPTLAQSLVQFRGNPLVGVCGGTAFAVVAVCPVFWVNEAFGDAPPSDVDRATRTTARGSMWFNPLQRLGLFAMAMLGNYYEEVLYRGYLPTMLERNYGVVGTASAIMCGAAFMLSHLPLAYVVTDTREPLMLFTLWEGVIAALTQMWWGIIPATIAHGFCIYLITTQLGRAMPYAFQLFTFVAFAVLGGLASLGMMPLPGL